MGFRDHFSNVAKSYSEVRPHYPATLFTALARLCPAQRMAWDCATGNGQAAVALAEHFERVIATDASAQQIANATPHPRVEYRVAPAETSQLDSASCDLITVAQAAHWFEFDAFYREARRVLVPGGVLACWTYNNFATSPAIDAVLNAFIAETLAPYWPKERRYVDDLYRSLPFPFVEPPFPPFQIEAEMTLARLAGYLGSWSATQQRIRATGSDPIPAFIESLRPLWAAGSSGDETRTARWQMGIRVGFNS